jgi:aminopeptidase N
MKELRRRLLAGAGVLITVAAVTLTSAAAAAADAPTPGAPGLGDRLFQNLGNGGYDAQQYALKLRYAAGAPDQPVRGVVRMDATATQNLSSFNLDFAGDAIREVKVNGKPARVDWQQEELVITPAAPLWRGRVFTAEVEFTSHPVRPAADDLYPVGWIATEHGSFAGFQPNTAHRAFPVNDHPADKARYRFELDVPEGTVAVANGSPTGHRTANGRTVWTYQECRPLASELVQLAVGTDLQVVNRPSVDGVAQRDVIAAGRKDVIEPAFANGPELLHWTINKMGGAFPTRLYGNLGVDLLFGYSLETQSLALHSYGLFDPAFIPGRTGQHWFEDPIQVHEITHEYFGNSVSPAKWDDVWLDEGPATYMMTVYEAEMGTIDEWGYASFEEYMRDQYRQGDQMRADFGPVARPLTGEGLFSPIVYDGATLVLYALQQKVGTPTFYRILTGWPKKFVNTSRGTEDFISYASSVAGRDLGGFLRPWVYGDATPPMPGHRDWTVDPVAATATAADTRSVHAHGHGWAHAHLAR